MHHQVPGQFNMQRLHPGYLCSICRKPGHAKSFCPEAGTIKHADFIKTPKGIELFISILLCVNSQSIQFI